MSFRSSCNLYRKDAYGNTWMQGSSSKKLMWWNKWNNKCDYILPSLWSLFLLLFGEVQEIHRASPSDLFSANLTTFNFVSSFRASSSALLSQAASSAFVPLKMSFQSTHFYRFFTFYISYTTHFLLLINLMISSSHLLLQRPWLETISGYLMFSILWKQRLT